MTVSLCSQLFDALKRGLILSELSVFTSWPVFNMMEDWKKDLRPRAKCGVLCDGDNNVSWTLFWSWNVNSNGLVRSYTSAKGRGTVSQILSCEIASIRAHNRSNLDHDIWWNETKSAKKPHLGWLHTTAGEKLFSSQQLLWHLSTISTN